MHNNKEITIIKIEDLNELISYLDQVKVSLQRGKPSAEVKKGLDQAINKLSKISATISNFTEQFSNLFAISTKIISSLDPQQILSNLTEGSRNLMKAEISLLWEITKDKTFINCTSQSRECISYLNEYIKSFDNIVLSCLESGKSIIIPDSSKPDEQWNFSENLKKKSIAIKPFKVDNEQSFVLILIKSKEQGEFDPLHLLFLQLLAEQASTALTTAKTHLDLLKKERIKQETEAVKLSNTKKTELLNIVAHELRNPLTNIIGFAEMLKDMNLTESEKRNIYDIVVRESKRLNRIVNDMLDLARIKSGKQRLNVIKFPINNCIKEVIDSFAIAIAEKNLVIQTNLVEPSLLVLADRDKVVQVLFNLLDNAVKYTPAEGKITISTEVIKEKAKAHELEDIDPALEKEINQLENDFVLIHISDTGPGIPKNDQDRIFEEFYRLETSSKEKIGGTGLGLSIARSIVVKHGGRIAVQSRPGQGSTFSFTLLLAK